MAETESKLVTKLVQTMYLGQTTVTKGEKSKLNFLIERFGLKMPLDSKEDKEDSDDEVTRESFEGDSEDDKIPSLSGHESSRSSSRSRSRSRSSSKPRNVTEIKIVKTGKKPGGPGRPKKVRICNFSKKKSYTGCFITK